jgi:hypothetical protein
VAEFRLLKEFRAVFEGKKYRHRVSNLGDFVALHLYEDLVSVDKSAKYLLSVENMSRVVNLENRPKGIKARRGDGTFGELVPGAVPVVMAGYKVARGPVATVEIGVEVKILAKAMIKQIDRVLGDFSKQVTNFKRRAGSNNPICVGIVGVNFASVVTGYEGRRRFRTDGIKHKHPFQEAPEALRRLATMEESYDEFLVLRYRAPNEKPFVFEWVNEEETRLLYGAALLRISNEYQKRF